ncbi:homeobox-DDT domain protein RLT2-like [Phragmites australis]|uniref:homeobox-DDT domain protein RLT2-like n=1 Tax=Phragmites australis TaxID=29695 RepID=UPI002D7887DA|nr:homeobox-DDT domain protein RLT2-like [Phragmites australis]
MESSGDEGAGAPRAEPGSPGPASAPAAVGGGSGAGASGSGGKPPVKRVMKTPYQLEVLERTYTEDPYPNETKRAELSVKLALTDRQLQMWFCHRRLKDRKPPAKRQLRDEEVTLPVIAPPPVLPPSLPPSEIMVGAVGTYGEPLLPCSRRGPGRSSAVPRISVPEIGRRYYESPQIMLPPLAPVHLTRAEHQVIDSVETLIGEPLREDGPVLGIEFDPLPPGAFGAPIVPEQKKQPFRPYETKTFSGHDPKLMKASAFLPTTDPYVPNTVTGKRKSLAGSSSHPGSQAVHEYQFLPEQPSDRYERASQSRFYDASTEASNSRISSLSTGPRFLHGADQAPNYTFHGQISGSNHLTPHGRSPFPSGSTDHEMALPNINVSPAAIHGQFGIPQVAGFENPLASSERMGYHDEDSYRVDRKRKHNEEAKIAREVEAHEKRIRKELEKQDVLNRKREEQMRREMERHDRERRKEEERLMRERQREEERLHREQRREHKRMEKFILKQSMRAEKLRQKEELRKEKEAARQKAANERATARRIAREYMELMEDERLELMELASRSKGLPSMLSLDSDTLQQLDSFRGMLRQFPTETVRLKVPFSVKPWTTSEDNIGNLLMVWKFFITFADLLGLPSFTLDEFVQALHDYDSRLLGELHVALLKSIIKDIEDVARTPSVALGVNQSSSANPGGGHPQIVEGAYAWGFNILTWQHHLNFLTWPEILRQFGLCAGFGPQLKNRTAENVFRDDNEGRDGEDVISILRNGSAAVNAAALMKERGYTNRRRSRHRLTPGTVKFAAFHVLSLEGSRGLTILEVAEKIQKSGLRDLTTSKTPEASISAALSRDTKLFERTAPSTYCVKTPYRKDPADSEAVLSAAREKIRVFQNSECEEVEKDVDDAERDEDSECDDADDDPDGDEVNIEEKDAKSPLISTQDGAPITVAGNIKESNSVVNTLAPPSIQTKPCESGSLHTLDSSTSTSIHSSIRDDARDTEIDESNQGESWVQGLAEGDYCDLSVEERLNALVALIGVATEGNSIRAILEERLEAASALKKQMWAEAQLDKRRIREEFSSKMQYDSCMGLKADAEQENNATESTLTPVRNLVKDNDGNASTENNDLLVDKQDQLNTSDIAHQWNGVSQELSANPESLSVQQYPSSEKTRSQLKSYIGHKAEQLYVYRSLPLGQDRRRNRYWQFSASASPYDPGSGRIFFESRDGYWRVIDSAETFEALVASLDSRGLRESHLHSMLQSIEPTFKEAIGRKKCASLELSAGLLLKNGSNEIISPNRSNEFGSPCSTLSGIASDNAMACSDTFKIEIGRNDVEKIAISKRAYVFLKWMWRECYNQQSTCALKYGKRRCSELIQSCDYCYQIYLAEGRHCSSCHKTFKPIHNFLEHSSQCEEKQRTDPNWKMQTADNSVPIGLRLLKLLLATIEASVPAEALQLFWTDGYRKSWGVKLYSTSSAEEVFQMLTVLEGAIKRDYLSSNYETTTELLNSSTQDFATQNSVGGSGSASVLPWVPDTTAAVALRLLDLDFSISYTLHPKAGSNKEREAGDFKKLLPRYTAVKNRQEIDQFGAISFDQQDGVLPTHSNGRRGRGRGSRGGSRGGRSRSRGGKVPRGVGSSSRIQFRDNNSVSYDKVPRKNAPRGRGRNRGRGRGLRTVRPRQTSELGARSIPKANLLGSFSMLSKANHTSTVHSPESSGAEEWALERRGYVKDDGNTSVSQSDESEENEKNGEPMNQEYDEQLPDYPRGNPGSSPLQMMNDGSEDDEDAEGDEEGEEDGESYEVEHPVGDEDDDVEMGEDDEVRDDDDDDGGDGVENADEDEGGTSSYSSEYSE